MGKSRRVRHKPMEHLRSWRESLGLSRQEVANRIGTDAGRPPVDQGTIAKWESGETAVRVEDLALLAAAYGIGPDRMFFPPGDTDTPELMKRAYDVLSQSDRKAVEQWLAVGEALVKNKT